MLSTDNSPPDGDVPCCSYKQSSPLLKGSSRATVERTSDGDADHDNLALQQEVDFLIKWGSLPKFSLRGYVNSCRSKDIETSWPFSQKNLQLCLKHGVKIPLPPFQPFHSVRNNRPFNARAIKETSLLEQGIYGNNLDGEKPPGRSSNHYARLCNPSMLEVQVSPDANSCRSFPGEKDFACTATTIHSQSEVLESSGPRIIGPSSSLVEPPALFEASASTSVGPPPPSQKAKKCKLIIKLGGSFSDPNAEAEGIASNCAMPLSEAMASKTCPVCRVFSSSSNTTLNAHIDQRLSAESTAKWEPESNLNGHRMKLRKTRLMSDICATAPSCTLEELGCRNGSSWAAVDHSTLPTQDPEAEVCVKEKRERTAPIYPGSIDSSYNDDVGTVYIDGRGTKLRILSKLNDRVGENARLCKALKKNKGCKSLLTRKKRCHLQKHHKYLKLGPQRKQSGSLNACKFKEGNSEDKPSQEKKQHQRLDFEVHQQTEPQAAGPPRHWVCFKRTGLSKKADNQARLQAAQDLLVENVQSCPSDSYADRSWVQESSGPSEDPITTPVRDQMIENPIHEARMNACREHSPSRKRAEVPLFGAEIRDHVVRPLNSLKKMVNPSREDSTSGHDSCILKPLKFNQTASLSNKTFRTSENSSQCNNKPFSLTSKSLSVSQSSIPESKSNVNRRYVTSKELHLQFTGQVDEDEELVAEAPSEVDQQYDLFHNYSTVFSVEVSERVSPARSNKPENKQESQPISFSNWEKSTVAESSQSEFQCYGHDVGRKMVRSVMASDNSDENLDDLESATKEARFHVEKPCTGPSSKIDDEETIMRLSESFHHEYHKLTSPFVSHSESSLSFRKCKLPLSRAEAPRDSAESSFGHGDELFLADEVVNGISGQSNYIGAELESKLEKVNSFSEFESILIPGPPGSFLPSPRGMSSDELQCNSSLTTSRVQSSHDQKELVDGDSSDSPVSDLNYSEKTPSSGPHSVSSGATIEPVMKNDATSLLKASFGVKRTFPEGGNLEVSEILPANGPLTAKDDHMRCCFQKGRISPPVALNYQDSLLLRRQTMSTGRKMRYPPASRTHTSNGSSEIFCFGDCMSFGFGKVLVPMRVNSDAAVMHPIHSDTDSACPSGSSHMLRLMGKNLMVVNKDEDTFTQFRQPPTGSRVSPVNTQDQELNSLYHAVTQDPDTLFQDPRGTECFENRP